MPHGWLIAAAAGAAALVDPAHLAKPGLWMSVENSPPAESAKEGNHPVIKLKCPFSTLDGWRMAWDLPLDVNFENVDWVRIRVRSDAPEAISGIVIYFETDSGWYTREMGRPDAAWTGLSSPLTKFQTEGRPGGWYRIQRMRIAVLPESRTDTTLYLGGIETASGMFIEDAARIGPHKTLNELRSALGDSKEAGKVIAESERLLAKAGKLGESSWAKRAEMIAKARRDLTETYAKAQKPREGELRGMWCHSGTGPDMGWTRAVDALAANNFNAVFPNMLWSGVCFYPSKVVPVSPEVASRGDQLKECLVAAKRVGISVHLWKVCWQSGWMADRKFAVPLRFAGRMQVSNEGKQGEWLCPSDSENRRYELAAILEVVRNYDLDGFHLDYIRYPGDEWCFCRTCRRNFEKEIGQTLQDWPAPVVTDGPLEKRYRDWRRNVITSFVAQVRRETRRIRPGMKLSAAVFPVAQDARESVLQDWERWVREGLVDFVCPMNYTEDLAQMQSRLRKDLASVDGRVPLYAGLYATYGPGNDQERDMAIAQVAAARDLGASGFVLFEMRDHTLTGLLPLLRLGLTSR